MAHPGLITAEDVDIFCGDYEARSLRAVYGYKDGWGALGPQLAEEITEADGAGRPAGRERCPSRRARARSSTGEAPTRATDLLVLVAVDGATGGRSTRARRRHRGNMRMWLKVPVGRSHAS